MNKTILVPPLLIKIGKKENLMKLQNLGQVFFGKFDAYRRQEEKEFRKLLDNFLNDDEIDVNDIDFYRRDSMDGLERRISGAATLTLKDKKQRDITIKVDDVKLNIFQNTYQYLYCLYAVPNTLDDDFKVDSRMLRFGESALIIKKPLEFINRLMDKIGTNYDLDYVTYYNKSRMKDGKYSVFQKSNSFDYQNEFRIVANLIKDNSVFIGDISDISILVASRSLLDLEFKVKS